jgi:hypothetical protein
LRRPLDIDVIDPDPGSTDDLEFFAASSTSAVTLSRTDRETVILADDRDQLFFAETRPNIDIKPALAQNLTPSSATGSETKTLPAAICTLPCKKTAPPRPVFLLGAANGHCREKFGERRLCRSPHYAG